LLQGIGQRVKDAGYPLGLAADQGSIFAFAAEHLRRERTCIAELTIQDRCLLDLLAYVRVLDLLDQAALNLLREIALTSFSNIDLVFYVPICDAIRNTHTIVETAEFRARIDAAIPIVAGELGIRIASVEGEPAERAEQAYSLLALAAPETVSTRPS
jgi:hypothetical protein